MGRRDDRGRSSEREAEDSPGAQSPGSRPDQPGGEASGRPTASSDGNGRASEVGAGPPDAGSHASPPPSDAEGGDRDPGEPSIEQEQGAGEAHAAHQNHDESAETAGAGTGPGRGNSEQGYGQAREPSEEDSEKPAPSAEEQWKQRADDMEQKYLRVSADYQNYVRRSQQNVESAKEETLMKLARSLLTVLDHFDHAMAVDTQKTSADAVIDGMRMVQEELMKTLRGFGIERFSPEPGEEFDPNRHEALMRQAAVQIESNHVVASLQPGYMLNDKTLRPAKVSVAE